MGQAYAETRPMTELSRRIFLRVLSFAALALLLGVLQLGRAQLPTGTSGRNFEHHYFEQKSRRPLLLIQGAQAQPQSDGRLLVREIRILTFQYQGSTKTTNLVAAAPTCTVDLRKRVASSAGPLRVSTVDNAFSIRGNSGFRFVWSQVQSHLSISNQVTTELDRAFVLGDTNKKP